MSIPAASVIVANQAALAYAKKTIVTNINMEIFAGEFICILGPNGSGKSTFLRAILGLIKPAAGYLQVLGHIPHHGSIHIGYMPQIRHPFATTHLSSRAVLEAAIEGTHYGLPLINKTKKQKVQEILQLVDAIDYAERPLQTLSGGERQRIFLAQALLDQPKLLLLDEPLSNLDPHYQEVFIKLLYEIKKKWHVTILFTAHDPNPLLKVASRVLYFARQKCVIGNITDIITSASLSALYGTPIEVIQSNDRLIVLGEGQGLNNQEYHHV